MPPAPAGSLGDAAAGGHSVIRAPSPLSCGLPTAADPALAGSLCSRVSGSVHTTSAARPLGTDWRSCAAPQSGPWPARGPRGLGLAGAAQH